MGFSRSKIRTAVDVVAIWRHPYNFPFCDGDSLSPTCPRQADLNTISGDGKTGTEKTEGAPSCKALQKTSQALLRGEGIMDIDDELFLAALSEEGVSTRGDGGFNEKPADQGQSEGTRTDCDTIEMHSLRIPGAAAYRTTAQPDREPCERRNDWQEGVMVARRTPPDSHQWMRGTSSPHTYFHSGPISVEVEASKQDGRGGQNQSAFRRLPVFEQKILACTGIMAHMIAPQNTHAYDYGTGIVEIAEEENKRLVPSHADLRLRPSSDAGPRPVSLSRLDKRYAADCAIGIGITAARPDNGRVPNLGKGTCAADDRRPHPRHAHMLLAYAEEQERPHAALAARNPDTRRKRKKGK
ncbi:hypothetical protein B0H13DRAFT_1890763 [Mycena leptocephala]|nr:hypothetical protein B0H13DRAFT_1890763 [Mycena leptocephala]